ncbi:MAG TPA: DUF427 domain-containing protein [Leeuwenhoekiella sp.]|nr:DUF427 domain-containing protein [Leeuwenhoekiella sp.]
MKALFNGKTIAESDHTIVVEGNHYFPPQSVDQHYLQQSSSHTTCPWKGVASYYTIEADGKKSADAAWYYPSASDKAKNIENYIAFWKDVTITS